MIRFVFSHRSPETRFSTASHRLLVGTGKRSSGERRRTLPMSCSFSDFPISTGATGKKLGYPWNNNEVILRTKLKLHMILRSLLIHSDELGNII